MGKTLILIVLVVWVGSLFGLCATASQEDYTIDEADFEQPEYFEVEATAYYQGEVCSTGALPRWGICAGKPEWYGKIIALYESDNGKIGEFIGYFECLDTGPVDTVRAGKVIDIYNPSREWCKQFGRKKVIAYIIEGRG